MSNQTPDPFCPATAESASRYSWRRRCGYECSSKGDPRFSAFSARLADGRTIEEHYQCDVKGYDPGGRNWRQGKGKPPLDCTIDLFAAYLGLWKQWADANPRLMLELATHADAHGSVLSDCFATTPVNQAHALSELLNQRLSAGA